MHQMSMNPKFLPEYQSVLKNTMLKINLDFWGEVNTKLKYEFLVDGYHHDGDFTVAVLVSADRRYIFTGVSKRNPEDKFILLRGRALALARAIRNAADALSTEFAEDSVYVNAQQAQQAKLAVECPPMPLTVNKAVSDTDIPF